MAHTRPRKRSLVECLDGSSVDTYKFRILLPSGGITDLILHDPGASMFMEEFVGYVRREFERCEKSSADPKPSIMWDADIYLEDMSENKIKRRLIFNHFKTNKLHILRLHVSLASISCSLILRYTLLLPSLSIVWRILSLISAI